MSENAARKLTPRLKRWKRSEVDETLQRIAERKYSVGPSMADALRMRGGK
jgi:uroporphyrinogen-III synthase